MLMVPAGNKASQLIFSCSNLKITRKRCDICSKLTIKPPLWLTDVILMFLLLTLNIFRTFLVFHLLNLNKWESLTPFVCQLFLEDDASLSWSNVQTVCNIEFIHWSQTWFPRSGCFALGLWFWIPGSWSLF